MSNIRVPATISWSPAAARPTGISSISSRRSTRCNPCPPDPALSSIEEVPMPTARIAGVGMIPFTKPGQSEDWDVMAEKAIRLALADAGVDYKHIQQAYAGYVYA